MNLEELAIQEIVNDEPTTEDALISLLPTALETAQQAVARQIATFTAINTLVDRTFKAGVDFDTIPGTNKPTLLLPGIEKTMGLLGLREEYNDIHTQRIFEPDAPFFFYEVECVLYHSQTGVEVARGQAVCHTREKSFMKQESRVCPTCGAEAIIKGKAEYGGGWLCWVKKEGCGTKYPDNDVAITEQKTGMVEDTQLVWDGANRARKIANKRAKADAVKRIGMLSEKFTVDMEDFTTFTDSEIKGDTVKFEKKITSNWSTVPQEVVNFLTRCKQLSNPPQDKETIYAALDIESFSQYTKTQEEAIKTVEAHMQELARIESETTLQDIDDSLAPAFEVGHKEASNGGVGPSLEVTAVNLDGTYECAITLTNGKKETVTKTYTDIRNWNASKKNSSKSVYGKEDSKPVETVPTQEPLMTVADPVGNLG